MLKPLHGCDGKKDLILFSNVISCTNTRRLVRRKRSNDPNWPSGWVYMDFRVLSVSTSVFGNGWSCCVCHVKACSF